MKIYSDRRDLDLNKLKEDQKAYENEFRGRKNQYDNDKQKYDKEALSAVRSKKNSKIIDPIISEIKSSLQKEINSIPGDLTIQVKYNSYMGYYIIFNYVSNTDKCTFDDRLDRQVELTFIDYTKSNHPQSYSNGISWKLIVCKNSPNISSSSDSICKYPMLDNTELLSSNDYDILYKISKLFKKIDKMNWDEILSRLENGLLQKPESISDRPVNETQKYDIQIITYYFDKILGKDLWIELDHYRGYVKVLEKQENDEFTCYKLQENRSEKEYYVKIYKDDYSIYLKYLRNTNSIWNKDSSYHIMPKIPVEIVTTSDLNNIN